MRKRVVTAPEDPKPRKVLPARDKCICPSPRFLPVPGTSWISKCSGCGAIKQAFK